MPKNQPKEARPMSFAICRTEKIKTWGSLTKSVGHNMRTTDEDRSHLNEKAPEALRVLLGQADWVTQWQEQVNSMHLRKLQQGQTHTLAREFFLGMSPEWMEGKSKRDVNDWAKANVEWLQERFGAERVKFAVMHLDEQTPHIAAYVVGLKADPKQRGNGWTLSDRELRLGGNKDALSKLQDEYAEAMQGFELQRGIKGSKAKHQETSAWRKQMQQMNKELGKVKVITPPPASLTDRVNIEEYAKGIAKAATAETIKQLMPYVNEGKKAKKLEKDMAQLRTMVERLEPLANAFKTLMEAVLGHELHLNTVQGLKTALTAFNDLIAKLTERNAQKLEAVPEAPKMAQPPPVAKRPTRAQGRDSGPTLSR